MQKARIFSNIEVHGIAYAIEHEAKRIQRSGGYSRTTCVYMAWQLVASIAK